MFYVVPGYDEKARKAQIAIVEKVSPNGWKVKRNGSCTYFNTTREHESGNPGISQIWPITATRRGIILKQVYRKIIPLISHFIHIARAGKPLQQPPKTHEMD